jgi:Arc/MetJ family transcription regulator
VVLHRRSPAPGEHLDIKIGQHHDAFVRTTLTLDRDVAERVAKEMRRTGRGLKATVNDALRRGLGSTGARAAGRARFTVAPHALGIRPGIDPDRLNQLSDELEAEDARRKLAQ